MVKKTTLREQRQKNRARQAKWREAQKDQGKKPLTITLSDTAKDTLDRKAKELGVSKSEVIELALSAYAGAGSGDNVQ